MGLETIVIASLAAGAVGAGVSAYNQNQAGKAQQALSNYNADATEGAANYNADQILAAGNTNADQILSVADHNAQLIEKTAALNANIAGNNAKAEVGESLVEAQRMRYNNRLVMGAGRARSAASGVVVGTGSPLISEVQTAGLLEMRALEAERQGRLRADSILNASAFDSWQAREAATGTRWKAGNDAALTRWEAESQSRITRATGAQQATLDRMSGTAARRAGTTGAVGTILQGASSLGRGYYGIN